MKYLNYYNGDNTSIKFEFEGLTKEESLRIQAYLFQDSTFFINDDETLDKLSEEQQEVFIDKPNTTGEVYLKKDPNNNGHIILSGYTKTVDSDQQEFEYNWSSNIYEGLNFIAFVSILEDRRTCRSKFSSINWCYEKSYKPDKLIRYDIKHGPIGSPEPQYDIIEYEVKEGFRITDNPSETFKNNKKEVKVKQK